MKVSILVPIFGVEKYIEKCAQSLFDQTYKDIEYIFVDDCSLDSSVEKLKKVIANYPHLSNKVKIIRHDTNKGLAGARITALKHATGEYIMHVDSDDSINSNAVEIMINAAIASDAEIVDAAYQKIRGDEVIVTTLPYFGSNKDYLHLILSKCGISNHQIWGKLIKRSLYVENNINAIEGVNHAEDYSVFPKLLFHCKKRVSLKEVVYYYNYDNVSSFMHSLSEKSFNSSLHAAKSVYEYIKENDLTHEYDFSLDFGMSNLYLAVYKNNLPVRLLDSEGIFISKYFILNFYIFLLHHKYTNFIGHGLFVIIKNLIYIPKLKCQKS